MQISSLVLGLVKTNTYFIENDKNVILVYPVAVYELIMIKLIHINNPVITVLLTPVISHVSPLKIDEGSMEIEGFKFKVLHTPGHSPGSLSFIFDDFAVVGDTLFYQGIGRTDLYKGDYETLVDSILDKLFKLEDDLPLFPGHGPYTTIEDEQLNPYLYG